MHRRSPPCFSRFLFRIAASSAQKETSQAAFSAWRAAHTTPTSNWWTQSPSACGSAHAPFLLATLTRPGPPRRLRREATRVAMRFQEDGTKVRVAASGSGAVVPYPADLKERSRPRSLDPGPLDTPLDAVQQVTFPGLEAEYEALQAVRAARRAATVEAQGLQWKYADAEQGTYQQLKSPQELATLATAQRQDAPAHSAAAGLAYPPEVAHLLGIRETLPSTDPEPER